MSSCAERPRNKNLQLKILMCYRANRMDFAAVVMKPHPVEPAFPLIGALAPILPDWARIRPLLGPSVPVSSRVHRVYPGLWI